MRRRWIVGLSVLVGVLLVGRAVSLAQREAKVFGIVQQKSARWSQPGHPTPAPAGAYAAGQPQVEPAANAEDRMAAFDGFLGRSRKEVDESIQTLSREAETLKARLQNVEAALDRWKAVAGALDQASVAATVVPAPAAEPDQLEPIPSLPASPRPSQPAAPPEEAKPTRVPSTTAEPVPEILPARPANPTETERL